MDKKLQQKIEVIYNDQNMNMDTNDDSYHSNNDDNNVLMDTIDIDKILNAHGNKTGLEM